MSKPSWKFYCLPFVLIPQPDFFCQIGEKDKKNLTKILRSI